MKDLPLSSGPNAIFCIGYGLERVHTGLLKACLDGKLGGDVKQRMGDLISTLAEEEPEAWTDQVPATEARFGEGGEKVDLALFSAKTGRAIPIEVKTDSNLGSAQLAKTARGPFFDPMTGHRFDASKRAVLACFGVTRCSALAPSPYTDEGIHGPEGTEGILRSRYAILDPGRVVDALAPEAAGGPYLLSDWVDALRDEMAWQDRVAKGMQDIEALRREHPTLARFRNDQDWIYPRLLAMVERFRSSDLRRWSIYRAPGASNQPIVHLDETEWSEIETGGYARWYWEFEGRSLMLKADLGKKSDASAVVERLWASIERQKQALNGIGVEPAKARRRSGRFVRVASFQVDPFDDLDSVMARARGTLDILTPAFKDPGAKR